MNHVFFLAGIGADLAQTARTTAEKFGLDAPHFFAQVISFCILAALLYRFAYKPILSVLEERRQTIAQSMANVEKIKQDLANAQTKVQELLSQASAQGNKLIEEARAAAARVQETETQKAIAAANDIIAKARVAGEVELERLKVELRKEFGRLVVQASMQVTGKILTPADQQRLAEETNQQLAA